MLKWLPINQISTSAYAKKVDNHKYYFTKNKEKRIFFSVTAHCIINNTEKKEEKKTHKNLDEFWEIYALFSFSLFLSTKISLNNFNKKQKRKIYRNFGFIAFYKSFYPHGAIDQFNICWFKIHNNHLIVLIIKIILIIIILIITTLHRINAHNTLIHIQKKKEICTVNTFLFAIVIYRRRN